MTRAAKLISFVFHPFFMVTYLLTIFALIFPNGLEPLRPGLHFYFILYLTGITFLMPALAISLFQKIGLIKNVTMVSRRERILPFFLMGVIYVGITYMLMKEQRMSLHDNLIKFLLITDVLVLVAFLTTLFYKVSIHSLAIWGIIGILIPLNKIVEDGSLFYPMLATILIAGLVMASRLKLHVHTSGEIWLGAALGLATSYSAMTLLF